MHYWIGDPPYNPYPNGWWGIYPPACPLPWQPAQYGWVCPRCGKVHGPTVESCDCWPGQYSGTSITWESYTTNREDRSMNTKNSVCIVLKREDGSILMTTKLARWTYDEVRQDDGTLKVVLAGYIEPREGEDDRR